MIWVMVILLIIVDQLSKYLVVDKIGSGDVVAILPGFFNLVYHKNTGAAWSFLADASWGIWVLKILSLLAAFLFAYVLTKTKHRWLAGSLALMLAGTIGNGIDRWLLGYVVDFLSFTFGSYVFPTFNVADSVLVIGTIAFAIGMFFIPHEEQFKPDLFVFRSKKGGA